MNHCPGCGSEVQEGAKYCSACGADLAEQSSRQSVRRGRATPSLRRPVGGLGEVGSKRSDWMLATYLRRSVARLLDLALVVVPLLPLAAMFIGSQAAGNPSHAGEDTGIPDAAMATLLVSFIVLAGYGIRLLFAARRGQTPGKQIMGIRVIKTDGRPSGWGYTLLRELGTMWAHSMTAFMPPFWLDYLWAFWDRDRQTLHDKVFRTLVVRTRR